MKLVLLLPLLTLTLAATALAQEKQDQIEGDTNEIKVFSLKNMSAGDAANLLRDVLRRVPDETITIDQRRNSVLARSTPDRLKVMEALLLKLDSTPTEPDQLLTVYTLRHAKAGDALDVIHGVVQPSEEEGALRLGLDERSNAIVALASPDEHKLIRSILDQVDKSNEPAAAAAPTSIRFEIYWIADGEETTPIPAEIKRVLDEQKEQLGIPRPAILASASIAAYVDGSGPPISLHGIQAYNGSHLDCDALVEALGNGAFRLQLRLSAGTDSKTSIDTSIRTTLGHPLFVASTTTSGQTEKPTVFVVRLTE